MTDLNRQLAPISAEAWSAIEEEAKRTLKATLSARRIVDFSGPHGWTKSAVKTGRTKAISANGGDEVEARIREVQPLVELRAPFELKRSELEAIGRGAKNPDLGAAKDAARAIATMEDRAVYLGYAAAGIQGLCEAAAGAALPLRESLEHLPGVVAQAIDRLRTSGIDGPYALALGPRWYIGLGEAVTVGGYPVARRLKELIDGPTVWAPVLEGAAVISMRGGDFELTVGRDFAIGYLDHTTNAVRLYLEESFTFRVLSPEAAVPLTEGETRRKK